MIIKLYNQIFSNKMSKNVVVLICLWYKRKNYYVSDHIIEMFMVGSGVNIMFKFVFCFISK
jgi:hypothetical protein